MSFQKVYMPNIILLVSSYTLFGSPMQYQDKLLH